MNDSSLPSSFSLLGLPVELWFFILQFMYDPKSFHSCLLTCKLFHWIYQTNGLIKKRKTLFTKHRARMSNNSKVVDLLYIYPSGEISRVKRYLSLSNSRVSAYDPIDRSNTYLLNQDCHFKRGNVHGNLVLYSSSYRNTNSKTKLTVGGQGARGLGVDEKVIELWENDIIVQKCQYENGLPHGKFEMLGHDVHTLTINYGVIKKYQSSYTTIDYNYDRVNFTYQSGANIVKVVDGNLVLLKESVINFDEKVNPNHKNLAMNYLNSWMKNKCLHLTIRNNEICYKGFNLPTFKEYKELEFRYIY